MSNIVITRIDTETTEIRSVTRSPIRQININRVLARAEISRENGNASVEVSLTPSEYETFLELSDRIANRIQLEITDK